MGCSSTDSSVGDSDMLQVLCTMPDYGDSGIIFVEVFVQRNVVPV